jgi:hypothetical protein
VSITKKTIILGLLFAVFGVSSAHGITQTWTWTGGGTDNNWTTTLNWTATIPGTAPASGGFENFGGSTRLTPYNNENNLHSNGIMFESGASAFTLTGNGISMAGAAGIANDSSSTQTVGMAITLTVSQQFSATDGPLVFSGLIDGAYNLMLVGPSSITLGAVGSLTPLSSLTATGGPVTIASITASGNVDFRGSTAVQLGSDPTVQSTGGNVIFGTATFQGNGNSLTLAAAATVTLDGALSGFDSLSVTANTLMLNGGGVTTAGDQIYSATVQQGADTTLTSLTGSLNLPAIQGNSHSLTLSTANTATLNGALSCLDSLSVIANTLMLNGGGVTTAGDQIYSATVQQGADTTLTSTGGGNVILHAIDGNNNKLIVSTAGMVTFNGAVSEVATLDVTGSVVNNNNIQVASGETLEFFGPVVNYGTIDAFYGTVIFHSTINNQGTIITSNCPPIITSIEAIGQDIHISFTTCSNVPYEVDFNPDLVSGSWTPMTNLTATSTLTTVIDSGATVLPKRFYRAGVLP